MTRTTTRYLLVTRVVTTRARRTGNLRRAEERRKTLLTLLRSPRTMRSLERRRA